jgi:LysR family transcriptional regulator, transcriptional activator of the cysJI operon
MIDNKLLTLIALSENGSYTKTAENLHLTQPAVSQHIKGLEKELGITIFNRTENGLKPTPQGVIAIRYAKRIQALYELERTRIEDSKKNMFSFTIGITHTSESSLVSNALANYAYSKDGLHITIVTDDISNLYTKLENYEIDLAIIEARNSDPRYRSLLLDTDSIMLAVSANNPLAKASMVTIDELKKQKMILRLPGSATRQMFEASLASAELTIHDFNVMLEVDSIATIKDLVIKDIGVALLARSTCRNLEILNKLVLLPIDGMHMIREVNIVYPKDFDHPEVLDGIVKSYKALAK